MPFDASNFILYSWTLQELNYRHKKTTKKVAISTIWTMLFVFFGVIVQIKFLWLPFALCITSSLHTCYTRLATQLKLYLNYNEVISFTRVWNCYLCAALKRYKDLQVLKFFEFTFLKYCCFEIRNTNCVFRMKKT